MSGDPAARLVELAAAHDAELLDLWARSAMTIRGDFDLPRLSELSGDPGFRVRLLFGDSDIELTLDANAPDPDQLVALAPLLANERERSELAAARTALDVEKLLRANLTGAFIEYARPGWARTDSAFLEAARNNWTDVVKGMVADSLVIGEKTVVLEHIAGPNPPGALPVAAEMSGPVGGEVSSVIAQLADSAAWTQIAVSTRIVDGEAFVALHHDQDAVVKVWIDEVVGGVDLLRWRMAGDDANREESLRHVLRFVTASSRAVPDARVVQRLAERQRIALVRDRAAEVFRAIADGQRATAELLETSAASLSRLVEDTTTTTGATVAGVIGVVALVAQNANTLPGWLILAATLATVFGVVAVVLSRSRRIDDQKQASDRLVMRLRNDPLLPTEEFASLNQSIGHFNLAKRANGARRTIAVLGAVACAVAIAAASWLVWAHDTYSVNPTPTTTPPSSISLTSTTAATSTSATGPTSTSAGQSSSTSTP